MAPELRLTTTNKIKEGRVSQFQLNTVRLPQDRCGYLQKLSPAWLKSWQSRFIILKDRKLKYFKSNTAKDIKVP